MKTTEYKILFPNIDDLIIDGNLRDMIDIYQKLGDAGIPLNDDLKSTDYEKITQDIKKLWDAIKTRLFFLNKDIETLVWSKLTHLVPAALDLKNI